MSNHGDSGNPLTSTSNPSIAVDTYDMRVGNQNLDFFLIGLTNSPCEVGSDQLHTPAPQLYRTPTDFSLTPSALMYVCLNNDNTRVDIFRPMFETILVHSLVVVADFFHNADKPCEQCREAVVYNIAVTAQIKYRLALDIVDFECLEGTKECWQTKKLMMTLQHMTEKLRLNGHLDLENLVDDKIVVATCLCIAQTLVSRNIDRKWLLGDFPFAESLVSRIASAHTSTSWSWLLEHNSRTEEVSCYDDFGGRAEQGERDDQQPNVDCEDDQGTRSDNNFHVNREEDNCIGDLAIWPFDGATTDVENSTILTRIPRTCSKERKLYNTKKHPQDSDIEAASKRRRRNWE